MPYEQISTNRSIFNCFLLYMVSYAKLVLMMVSGECRSIVFVFLSYDFRSSRPEVLCKKGVLTNFIKFTGKHLCQSLFFNKVTGRRPVTLLNKKLWHRCFSVHFMKFLRTPFQIEHLWWLLLSFHGGSAVHTQTLEMS